MLRRSTAAAVTMCALLSGPLAAGCSRDGGGAAARSSTTATSPPVTLPFVSVTKDQLGEQLRLRFPDGTADFLTARLPNRTQLDVTFTVPSASVGSFIRGSQLPVPAAGRRVITHTSPLWKLNVDGSISGSLRTVTTPDGNRLRVAVELVDDAPDRVRVRMVVTPATNR